MGSGTVSTQREHTYIAIDLKSFYASVECVARGLDPLTTHLVAADETRTDKTICLAVSPSLKNYGIPGRARLFEVKQRLNGVNIERAVHAPGGRLIGESCDACDLERSPGLKASMVIAKPRMAHYHGHAARASMPSTSNTCPHPSTSTSTRSTRCSSTPPPYLRSHPAWPRTHFAMAAEPSCAKSCAETGITATAGIGANHVSGQSRHGYRRQAHARRTRYWRARRRADRDVSYRRKAALGPSVRSPISGGLGRGYCASKLEACAG